jgi:hypothetical protein
MNELELKDEVVTENGDMVLRSGKFFEVDTTFTDMNGVEFSVSEGEFDAIAPDFKPSHITVNHQASPLDGFIGSIQRLWRDGKDIMAEFNFPKYLHEKMGGSPIKISSEWDVQRKMPTGVSLVMNPAVQDAVMMAAFSAKLDSVTKIDDVSTKASGTPDRRAQQMSPYDRIKALFGLAGVPADKTTELLEGIDFEPNATAPPVTADFSQSPQYVAMSAQIESLNKSNAELVATFAEQQKSAQFGEHSVEINKLVRERKISPAIAQTYLVEAKANPAMFSMLLPALQAIAPQPFLGGKQFKPGESNATAKFQSIINEKISGGMDASMAYKQACSEQPELVAQFSAESEGK